MIEEDEHVLLNFIPKNCLNIENIEQIMNIINFDDCVCSQIVKSMIHVGLKFIN